MIADRRVVIGRMRIRTSEPDRNATSVRVGSRLSAVQLRPAGLTPAAVLVVRRLPDPLPHVLDTNRLGPVESRWEFALRTRLDRLVALAARPVDDPVPTAAPAVRFADRAELLACLASDWLAGILGSRWWWRWLIQPGSQPEPARAWAESAAWVPAALDILAGRGLAVPFARRLPAPAITAVLDAVIAAFDLADGGLPATTDGEPVGGGSAPANPTAAPPAPPRRQEPVPEAEPVGGRAHSADPAAGTPTPAVAAALQRWQKLVPEASADGLSPQPRLLLALGLMLRRAPALTRQPSFLAAARRWTLKSPPSAPALPWRPSLPAKHAPPLRPPKGARLDGGAEPANVPTAPYGARSRMHSPAAVRTAPAEPGSAFPDSLQPDPAGHGTPAHGHKRQSRLRQLNGQHPSGPELRQGHPVISLRGSHDPGPLHPAAGHPDAPQHEVCTRLGGLFYLLNLAKYLELYGDFTTPTTPGIALDMWDFVTLLSRRLMGNPVPNDPVWDLLAALAGRDRAARPGKGFTPPADWRVPRAWLAPIQHDVAWRWSAAAGRLRVEHPAGFPVLDVPRTDEQAATQLRRELERFEIPPGGSLRRSSLPPLPRRPLARWVAALAAYTTARLARALGHPPARAVNVLLWHRASVAVTFVHVDVTLPLAALPIEIRLAGLDRDPGWIPAAGRFVAFHFD